MGAKEFLISVAAIVIGLILGKMISRGIAKLGVPIAAGNPVPQPLTPAA